MRDEWWSRGPLAAVPFVHAMAESSPRLNDGSHGTQLTQQVRKLEQANDDMERNQRMIEGTVATLQEEGDRRLEELVMSQSELEENQEVVQRLREELNGAQLGMHPDPSRTYALLSLLCPSCHCYALPVAVMPFLSLLCLSCRCNAFLVAATPLMPSPVAAMRFLSLLLWRFIFIAQSPLPHLRLMLCLASSLTLHQT